MSWAFSKIYLIAFLILSQTACVPSIVSSQAPVRTDTEKHLQLGHYTRVHMFKGCLRAQGIDELCMQSLKHKSEAIKSQAREYSITIYSGPLGPIHAKTIESAMRKAGFEVSRISYNTEASFSGNQIRISEFIPVISLLNCHTKLGEYKAGCSVVQNRALILANPKELISNQSPEAVAFETPNEHAWQIKGGKQ